MADSKTFTGYTNVKTDGSFANTIGAVTTAATFNAFDSTKSAYIISGSTSAVAIHGITAGIDGQRISIINLGTGVMTMKNQSTSSSVVAADKIISLTGADVASTGAGAAELIYSESSARWLLINSQA